MKTAAHPNISLQVHIRQFTLKNTGQKSPVLAISLTELSATRQATQATLRNVTCHSLAGLGNVRSFQQFPALPSVMQGLPAGPTTFLSGCNQNNGNCSRHPLPSHPITKNT